jgi:preprotein translocase subunit SecG
MSAPGAAVTLEVENIVKSTEFSVHIGTSLNGSDSSSLITKEGLMKTHSTNTLNRWTRFLGTALIAIAMVSAVTFSQPAAPTLATPADAARNQQLAPTLTWDASVGATSYQLQVSTASDFSTTVY